MTRLLNATTRVDTLKEIQKFAWKRLLDDVIKNTPQLRFRKQLAMSRQPLRILWIGNCVLFVGHGVSLDALADVGGRVAFLEIRMWVLSLSARPSQRTVRAVVPKEPNHRLRGEDDVHLSCRRL